MLYQNGEPLFLTHEVEKQAEAEQSGALESDVREGMVEEYLERLLPEDWDRMDLAERRGFLRNDQFNGGGQPALSAAQWSARWRSGRSALARIPSQIKRSDTYDIFGMLDAHRRLGEVQGEQERPDTPSALWAAALLSARVAQGHSTDSPDQPVKP